MMWKINNLCWKKVKSAKCSAGEERKSKKAKKQNSSVKHEKCTLIMSMRFVHVLSRTSDELYNSVGILYMEYTLYPFHFYGDANDNLLLLSMIFNSNREQIFLWNSFHLIFDFSSLQFYSILFYFNRSFYFFAAPSWFLVCST